MNETSTSDQRTSKRRRTCPDNGIVTSPPMPPTSDATNATSEETLHHQPEQRQQSSTSRIPSLQHLKHTNPLHPSGYNSSGGYNGTNTNSRSGMAMCSTAHQSFKNSVEQTQESISRGEEPISECEENGPSESSNAVPSRISFSAPTGEGRHRTDEQGHPHQLGPSLEGGQSKGMCSAFRSLTLRLRISHEWCFANRSSITSGTRCFSS